MGSQDSSLRSAPSAKLIVEEVLRAVLSSRRVRQVLEDACQIAGIGAVPYAPISLRVFVEGALFSTLSRQLGISDALDVSEQIRGALALALRDNLEEESSGIRLKRSEAPGSSPHVLVLSQASLVVFLLQDVLDDDVNLIQLKSQDELENRLARMGAQPMLIVVDRRHPCVGPGACPILVERSSPTSTVVWWGADEAERAEVERRLEGGPRLVPAAHDLDLADLGLLCRGVIEFM